MIVVGIETSCDETAVAVIELRAGTPQILSEVVSSQTDLHSKYGGVVPELASREHLKALPLMFDEALRQSGITPNSVDGVAVTRGPGLKGCLLMGYDFAKALAICLDRPFLGVNHIEGHIFSPFLLGEPCEYPFLALIVSGGHTEIQLVRDLGSYELIARTRDDAAGEAFDKSANLLGLGYPGGALLATLGDSVADSEFKLPQVMRESRDFSFSGLKTAVSQLISRQGNALGDQVRRRIAHTIQRAIVDALMAKIDDAIEFTGVRRVAVVGGVSANRHMRDRLSGLDAKVYFAEHRHCMDNAAMIAFVGASRFSRGELSPLSSGVLSRWPVESMNGV